MRPMKCESLMDREGTTHLGSIVYPKLISPKFDGNRCYIENGEAKSSSGKPIRNNFIREYLESDVGLDGLDGELIVGPATAKDVRRVTSSGVGTRHGEPDFTLYVFDNFLYDGPFRDRLNSTIEKAIENPRIVHVDHTWVYNEQELLMAETEILTRGYEGVILRDATAPYKEGRSTLKENWALKLKRFVDAEAVVISYFELEHNDNEATLNEHGYTERSSHKDNKRPGGVLGGLEVRDIKTGVEFRVGTGFDARERKLLWEAREHLMGRHLTYKHFPVGAKDKPNLPSFVSFRDTEDMTE